MDAERDARLRAEEQKRRERAEQRAARKEAEAQRQREAYAPAPAPSYRDQPSAPVRPARRLVEDICARFTDDPARREKCEWRRCRAPEHQHEALCQRLYGSR
jgi:hypothetical protein